MRRRYGVQLPNTDGRIGMAAIVFSDSGADWKLLAQHVKRELPSYAIPYFVRRLGAQEVTGTFKHRKVELVKEGWAAGGDDVWFYGESTRARDDDDDDAAAAAGISGIQLTRRVLQTLPPATTSPWTPTSSAASKRLWTSPKATAHAGSSALGSSWHSPSPA